MDSEQPTYLFNADMCSIHTQTKPLSVALVTLSYYPSVGGVPSQVADMASALQNKGVAVSVITKLDRGLPSFEMIQGIPVYRVHAPGPRLTSSPTFLIMGALKLRQLQPDIIHAQELTLPTTIAIVVKSILGTPIVATAHSSGPKLGEVSRMRRSFLGEYRLALLRQQVDMFTIISSAIEAELVGLGIPSARRVRIPNGIDTRRFAPVTVNEKKALRTKLNLPDVPIAICTGRLSSEKRLRHQLAIWPAVRQVYPEALLLLLGSGPEESALRRAAVPGVRFLGDVQDVAPYLQASDLFVLSSVSEGFSLATLEALSVGLPVVVTPVGAIPEMVTPGQNGLIIPPDDVEALREAIITLLGESRRYPEMKSHNREQVSDEYSISRVVDKLLCLYNQLAMRKV